MALRASDVVPISEAGARLSELADEVAARGSEKVLTMDGASHVALMDARKLDYYHAVEAEHAGLVLVDAALGGLQDVEAGRVVEGVEPERALSLHHGKPRTKA